MLITHHLLFTTEVVSPLELDDHSGAALRGNLFEALWQRFCTNKAAPICADCPLHSICPVSALVAPLREENPPGQRDIPRPYVILPPLGTARIYEPGEQLCFGLTLFGTIIQLLPYVILSVPILEACGLGHKVQVYGNRRGRFRVRRIEAYHPFTGERQCIYQHGKPLVQVPTLSVTPADVAAKAATLPTDRITLDFLTPTCIVDQERVQRHLTFRPLVMRLNQRLTSLQAAYGEVKEEEQPESTLDLVKLATDIICLKDQTHWEAVTSYSRRQHRSMPISGIMGRITFAGDLAPFRELLTWGELIHAGKSAVKGNGWYKIVE
jgi:CRISPR-associated endoribonuclease Cas6